MAADIELSGVHVEPQLDNEAPAVVKDWSAITVRDNMGSREFRFAVHEKQCAHDKAPIINNDAVVEALIAVKS